MLPSVAHASSISCVDSGRTQTYHTSPSAQLRASALWMTSVRCSAGDDTSRNTSMK